MSDSTTKQPVEGKVYAGAFGAGAGVTFGAFVLWLLGVTVPPWKVPADAVHAAAAIAAVPAPVNGFIVLALAVGGSFVNGYMAKHTARPQPTTDAEAAFPAPVGWSEAEPAPYAQADPYVEPVPAVSDVAPETEPAPDVAPSMAEPAPVDA